MDSSNQSETGIKISSAIFISFGFCCLLLCCGAYLFLRKEKNKRNQIHLTNHRRPSEAPSQIFTIDLPDPHSSNITINDPSYLHLYDKPPPPYESIQESLLGKFFSYKNNVLLSSIIATHHESNVQILSHSTTEQIS